MTAFEPRPFLRRLALLLCLVVACTPTDSGEAPATHHLAPRGLSGPSTLGWSMATSAGVPRRYHTATRLPDGKLLVVGGIIHMSLATAELYDPATGAWAPTGSMAQARYSHTATLLPDGKVLVAGGSDSEGLASAELYDPATGQWTSTGALAEPRTGHAAALLPGGKVLVMGGSPSDFSFELLRSAEIYDPATGTWSPTKAMADSHSNLTATPLPNGKVLVVGSDYAELYNPASGTWSLAGWLVQARVGHTATLLPNGNVLVVGGLGRGARLSSAELYNPATGAWSSTGPMAQARIAHTATLLPNGNVLVVGGIGEGPALATTEVYEPASGTWSSADSLAWDRHYHTTTLLPNGRLLVVGGATTDYTVLAETELSLPLSGASSFTGPLAQARQLHTATRLTDGRVLVVGGSGERGESLRTAELYDPRTGTWAPTGSLAPTFPPGQPSALLLPSGKVLLVVSSPPTNAAALYDPVAGTWSSTGAPRFPYEQRTLTLLANGQVLLVGGDPKSITNTAAELYDPTSGQWSYAGTLAEGRGLHTATLLSDGKVLVTGGTGRGVTLASAEVFHPDTRTWSSAGALLQPRASHTATPLPNGKVLLVGGTAANGSRLAAAELYDPATRTASTTGALQYAREAHTATPLPDGAVLVVGGLGSSAQRPAIELYHPATETWLPAGSLNQARHRHSATLLSDGMLLVAGGLDATSPLASAELYAATAVGALLPLPRPFIQVPAQNQTFTTKRPVFSGGATPGATVRVSIDGTLAGECTATPEGSWTLTSAALPLGAHVLTAVVIAPSMADILSAPSAVSFRLEAPKAELRLTSAPAPSTRDAVATFAFSSALPDVSFECSLDSAAFAACSSPHTSAPLGDGPHTFQVRARDSEGLVDPTPIEHRWTVDTLAPARPTLQEPAPAQTLFTATPRLSGTAEPGSTVRVSLDGTDIGQAGVGTDGAWRLTAPPLREGPHRVTATAEDAAGNVSPPSPEVSFTFALPDTALDPTSLPAATTRGRSATFAFSASPSDAAFECSLEAAAFSACVSPQQYTALPDGEHTFRVRARNAEGLVDPTPAEHRWTVDTRAPAGPAISVPTPNQTFFTPTPSISGTTAVGSAVRLFIDGTEVGQTGVSTDGSWVLTAPALGVGTYTVTASAQDLAGNTSELSLPVSFSIANPNTAVEATSAPQARTRERSASFVFSSTPSGASFECSLDGAAFAACSSPQGYAALPDGAHVFQVRARTSESLVDASPAEHLWTVDTTAPERPDIQVPTPHQSFFTSNPVFSGTAEPGNTVHLLIDGTKVGETLANAGGYWELPTPQLDWGEHRATALATDPAGNESALSLEVSFTTVQRGYYGMSCAAGGAAWQSWPLALLLLGLLRRTRRAGG